MLSESADFTLPNAEVLRADPRWAELLDQGFVFSHQRPSTEAEVGLREAKGSGHMAEIAPAYDRYDPSSGEPLPDQVAIFVRPTGDIYRGTRNWYRDQATIQGAVAAVLPPCTLES